LSLLRTGLVSNGQIRAKKKLMVVIPLVSVRRERVKKCRGGHLVNPHSGEIAASWGKQEFVDPNVRIVLRNPSNNPLFIKEYYF